jgi:hypothetical protein
VIKMAVSLPIFIGRTVYHVLAVAVANGVDDVRYIRRSQAVRFFSAMIRPLRVRNGPAHGGKLASVDVVD